MKWRLFKNGDLVSYGSLDYGFDTIENGRIILTPEQQELKEYNVDKSTYDSYEFYMWLSDSCQSEDVSECLEVESQENLIGKKISGKVQVELYADKGEMLVRKPSKVLNVNNCITESENKTYGD